MPDTLSVLAVTPFEEDIAALRRIFAHTRWQLFVADRWDDATRILDERPITLMLCSDIFPEGPWTRFFERADQASMVLMSENAGSELWAEALNRGALDVITKPFDTFEVLWVIASAARQAAQRKALAASRQSLPALKGVALAPIAL